MLSLALAALAQAASPLAVIDDLIRNEQDVIHYDITLSLPDGGSAIYATTEVYYVIGARGGQLVLDFDDNLVIESVHSLDGMAESKPIPWRWSRGRGGEPDQLVVEQWGSIGDTLAAAVTYRGTPSDGLVIRSNLHGRRTVFADNWPNRAHHWFPCEDHPSDKATVQFNVETPLAWRAVANGRLLKVDTLAGRRHRWHWREDRPIPVHTMVVGAGIMSVAVLKHGDHVPQSVWTFPDDSAFALQWPFRHAVDIVAALSRLVGPFPYEKLAHVESSTRYGGMENSSAIFYAESGYVERNMGEGVVAHEIAHQWFGDAVSQMDWHHLWLSEGFASYFGPLSFELIGEKDSFADAMRAHRSRYMGSVVVTRPVIDTTLDDPVEMLNANNYQKGAWILHMLRAELGDSAFFGGIRDYYASFRDSTVLSSDFAAVMERRAGRPLDWFFGQWLLQPGYPQLDVTWEYREATRSLAITVHQVQHPSWGLFRLRLPMVLQTGNDAEKRVLLRVSGSMDTVNIPVAVPPDRVLLDPDGTLLMSVSVSHTQRGF
jgi:aminopeptidase N